MKERYLIMKKKFQKLYIKLLEIIPVFTAIMLTISVNSTACWYKGQDKLPNNAKQYRKF